MTTYFPKVEKVSILFRCDRDGSHVTAVFPSLAEGPNVVRCYEHVGQHSACSRDWYWSTRPARPDEYANLLAEVRSIYESDGDCLLVVRKRNPPNCRWGA